MDLPETCFFVKFSRINALSLILKHEPPISKSNHIKEQRKGRVSVLETLACLALTDC